MKFVVAPLPSPSSSQIRTVLTACQMFRQSFDGQIRRIVMSINQSASSQRSRSRHTKAGQSRTSARSLSVHDETTLSSTTLNTDEGYRSSSSAANRRRNFRQQKSTSIVSVPSRMSVSLVDSSPRIWAIRRNVHHVKERCRPTMNRAANHPLGRAYSQRWHRRRPCRRNQLISLFQETHQPSNPPQVSSTNSISSMSMVLFSWTPAMNCSYRCLPTAASPSSNLVRSIHTLTFKRTKRRKRLS